MRWSSFVDPVRALPLAVALVAIYVLAALGAAHSFAPLASLPSTQIAVDR